ncbi:MAG TPA: PAS domain S-box protein [Nitrospira sp.]|nr:PAS domain S-box protein [Nitrospira sp.]
MSESDVTYDALVRENAALRARLAECEARAEPCRPAEQREPPSEERLQRAANSAGVVMYDFDLRPGGRFILQGMECITGVKPEDVQSTLEWWASRLHPQDAPAYFAALEAQLRTGGVVKSTFRLLHALGDWVHVESSREVVLDARGHAVRLVGTLVDISQRAAAEAALRESEARYRVLADTMPQVVLTATACGLVEYVNRPGLDYLGLAMEEAIGLRWLAAVHPADREAVAGRWLDCMKIGKPYEFEHRMLRADGEYRWQLARAVPITNESGGIVRWIGTSTDIHDRKQAEEALLESRAEAERQAKELDHLYQTSPAGLAFLDHELRFERINRTLATIHGLSVEAHLGRRVGEILPPGMAGPLGEILRQVLATGEPAMNVELPVETERPAKGRYWLANYYPLKDREGQVLGINAVVQDITERKRADQALQKSHAFIRQIIDTDPNFIFAKDREGRFTLVNRAVADCYGTTVQDLLGKSDADFNANKEEVAFFLEKDREVIDSLRDVFIPEEVITDAFGATRWLQTVKRPLFDEEGNATQVLGVATDITQRKRMEQALRESEARLQAIMDRAPASIFIKDRAGRHLFANKECGAALGLDASAMFGKTERELVDAELAQQFRTNDLRVWESGEAQVFEERIPSADGVHTFLSHKLLLRDVHGEPYALCGIATDITERRKAEEALRESEERFRMLADNMSQCAWTADAVGRLLWYNRRWYEYTGTTFDEMQGKGWQKFHHPDHLDRVLTTWRQAHEQGEAWEQTFPLRGRDGSYRWFLSRAMPIRDADGRILRWFGTNTDVTDLRQAQEELHEGEERLRLALAGGQMGAWDVSLTSDSTRWDAKEFELLGVPPHSITPSGAEFYRRVFPEDRALIRESVQRAIDSTGSLEHEFRVVLPDGQLRWLAAKGQVLKGEQGKPVRMIGVNFDITERKRTEARLRSFAQELEARVAERTREMAALHGRLRALTTALHLTEQRERQRLATDLHDYLAQLLALVRMKLGQMKRLAPPPALADIVHEAEAIVHEALTYTRTLVAQLSPPVLHEFGLPIALKWLAEQMVRQELSVEVRQSVPDRIPLPEDQAVLLFQSVRELLINVRKHAMTNQAVVSIDRRDDELCITVRDHGAGVDLSAAAASADQPSATSSKFGLFSIRERMLAIGGRFELDSAPGKGMTARLIVPFSPLATTDRESTPPASSWVEHPVFGMPHAGNPVLDPLLSGLHDRPEVVRVLLVDDHAMVREGLKGLLHEYPDIAIIGEAWDGEEAVAFVDKLRPDCVIMDINMPKIDGIEATRRIKAAFTAVAVVGLSVNTSREVEGAMRRAGADDFLSKGAPAEVIHRSILTTARKH